MSPDTSHVYRQRIYASYATARDTPLAPENLDGLSPRLPYLRQLAHRHFPEDRDVVILELGCGHGALLHVLQQQGYRNVRGVDGSPDQVAAALRLGIAGVKQNDVMAALAGTPTVSQDVVVAFDLIEHFSKDELIPLVDEVHRVLKPGGRWVIHAPNAEGPFSSRMRHWDFTHELAFTRTSLDQLMRASGFTRVECFEDRPAPHGLKSLMRLVLWRVMRGALMSYLAVETGTLDRRVVLSQNLLAVVYKGRE